MSGLFRVFPIVIAFVLMTGCGAAEQNSEFKLVYSNSDLHGELLYVAMAKPTDDADGKDKAILRFAGPPEVTKVRYCRKFSIEDCTEANPSAVLASASSSNDDRAYYRTSAPVPLGHEVTLSAIGYDANDKALASSTIKFLDPSQPVTPVPQLDETKNITLTGKDNRKTRLADEFKGKYMLIEFSGTNCRPCRTLAHSLAGNTRFQNVLASGKCSNITIVDSLSGWLGLFSSTPKVADHSFSTEGGLHAAARAIGFSLRVTPSIVLIDDTGKMVTGVVNSVPSEFYSRCE